MTNKLSNRTHVVIRRGRCKVYEIIKRARSGRPFEVRNGVMNGPKTIRIKPAILQIRTRLR
jgi:hypothetical protein